jgi:hypothetical protein
LSSFERGYWIISENFGRFYLRFVAPARPLSILVADVENAGKREDIDMKLKTSAQALVLAAAMIGLGATPGFAKNCQVVGGGILTNFLDATHTEGTSSGDIKGAVGVQILSISGNVYHVQHHWVTESGDTIYVKDAFLTAFPTSDPNRVLADYLDGANITGGTGRFDGATGTLFAFGAADLKLGQITLRYTGTVCFPTVELD